MSWTGLPEILEKYIMPEPNSGCWIWLGALRDVKDGYGGTTWKGKSWRAHRLIYNLLKASAPQELDIDHLCRNRLCCNPDHLEAVSRKINISRGAGVAARNARKTHCPKGHVYSEENTYVWNGQRFCRICSDVYKRTYSENKKKQAAERNAVFMELWDPLTG